jgi:ribosomal protein L17
MTAPAGRALGSRNKQTLAAEAALFEHAQQLVDTLVTRAKNGDPAAMRLAMERILPTGRGRPLPIELPPVRSAEDAQAAVGTIMDALQQGALSAREAVDLINVVTALTRLTGTIEYIQKVARREVAKAAQALGIDHFDPGPNAYARQMAEMNAHEDDGGRDGGGRACAAVQRGSGAPL